MRILFLVPYPTEGPSNRYRVEQYLPYLKENGIYYKVRPFMSSKYYNICYKKSRILLKALYFLQSVWRRASDVFNSFSYDVIFIHIEAFPLGPAFIEWFLSKIKKPIIFDFEDAVYLPREGLNNFIKCPSKFFTIVKLSKHIIVCNDYLKEFLSKYNKNISVIPTSIDTDKFFPLVKDNSNKEKVVIGWIGSHTTVSLLLKLENVLKHLAKRHDFILKIVGADKDIFMEGVDIINEAWTLDTELNSLKSIDIGIYPLPDNEWAKAKTPFKTIQYMSVGIPVVASRVAGNKSIVQDGENGFIVNSEDEWILKLSRLIENAELRKKIGLNGRKTVEGRYSLVRNGPVFLDILNNIYQSSSGCKYVKK